MNGDAPPPRSWREQATWVIGMLMDHHKAIDEHDRKLAGIAVQSAERGVKDRGVAALIGAVLGAGSALLVKWLGG